GNSIIKTPSKLLYLKVYCLPPKVLVIWAWGYSAAISICQSQALLASSPTAGRLSSKSRHPLRPGWKWQGGGERVKREGTAHGSDAHGRHKQHRPSWLAFIAISIVPC